MRALRLALDSTAVVSGAGGLGHTAVRVLSAAPPYEVSVQTTYWGNRSELDPDA